MTALWNWETCLPVGKRRHVAALQGRNFGVRRHDCALELGDMSPSGKAATCRRTPKVALQGACQIIRLASVSRPAKYFAHEKLAARAAALAV